MGDLIAAIIDFVATIWAADSQVRSCTTLGESEHDRKSRRSVTRFCVGGVILL